MSHEADGGARRAAEVSEAMLGMPGYADDSLLFTVRYGERAKNTLRQCDWEEFQRTVDAMAHLWIEAGRGGAQPEAGRPPADQGSGSGSGSTSGSTSTSTSTSTRAAELRARALRLIGHFPDLVRDFDRFTASCQATMAAMARSDSRA